MDVKGFENFVFEKMAETRFPGLSVAMVKGDELVYSRGFGVADMEKRVAAAPETVYAAASITKSFGAIAILKLAEQGKLSVEDEVAKYLEYPVTLKGGPVRVKHLLTHTTGLTAIGYVEALIGSLQGLGNAAIPVAGPKDIPVFMRGSEDWIGAEVGDRWFYNNEQYVLLGEIVGKVSGMRWEEYVRENILRPLGMTGSGFYEEEVRGTGRLAVPYAVKGQDVPKAGKQLFNVWGADAALFTNVLDLAKYVSMFLRNGRPVMAEASYREMTKERVAVPWQPAGELFGEKSSGAMRHYGYGLLQREFFGETLIGHSGSVNLSTGYFGFLPASGVGVALMGNSGAGSMPNWGQAALAYLLDKDPLELGFLRTEKIFRELSGMYEGFRRITRYEVKAEANFLMVKDVSRKTACDTTMLVPVRLDEFDKGEARFMTYADGAKMEVEFRRREGVWEMIFERYLVKRVGPLGK